MRAETSTPRGALLRIGWGPGSPSLRTGLSCKFYDGYDYLPLLSLRAEVERGASDGFLASKLAMKASTIHGAIQIE